ncbi:uncharacterized protein LOC135713449 [Ochlerotatus camptorhynchus]|uniref:uncharacterized protein LOC135713449 n=1 Tax=Ochlerotatus camptorhynchus TaxID=644619 RepID=UPI0031D10DC3
MMLMLQLRIMVEATLLLILSLLIVHCNARVVRSELGKHPSLIHNEDEVMFHNLEYPNMVENDEENEVIAVRLLNSHLSKSLLSNPVDVQNVSYESVQDVRTDENRTELETEGIQRDTIETTTARNKMESTTSQTLHSYDKSLEEDWVRSQIEIPLSSEEEEIHYEGSKIIATPGSFTTSTTLTTPKSTPTTAKILFRATTLPPSTFRSPVVFGYRRRKARNHHYYYDELPEIDFDQIDLGDLEDSEINGKRLKELVAHGYEPESIEQPVRPRKRRPKMQPIQTTECPCANERRQQSVDDYDDQSVEHRQLAPLKKRFINQQNQLPTEDFLDPDMSMEQAERVQGALERIMGIVTIMSHVDSFIHKKTKQSIRRLAKLYESEEE